MIFSLYSVYIKKEKLYWLNATQITNNGYNVKNMKGKQFSFLNLARALRFILFQS